MRKTKKVICELFVDMLLFNSLEGKVLSASKISRKELYIKAFHKAVSIHKTYKSFTSEEPRHHAFIYCWLISDALDKKILNKKEANDLLGDLYFKRKLLRDNDYWGNWEKYKYHWFEQESTKHKPYKFFYFHDDMEY